GRFRAFSQNDKTKPSFSNAIENRNNRMTRCCCRPAFSGVLGGFVRILASARGEMKMKKQSQFQGAATGRLPRMGSAPQRHCPPCYGRPNSIDFKRKILKEPPAYVPIGCR